MAISFESALGIHESALKLRGKRAEVLANNLANADTPNFKARDLDFRQVLANESGANSSFTMRATNARHLSLGASGQTGPEVLYRTPHQPSIDGNTVEEQVEHSEYMKNALQLQASFTFLNSRFKGLMSALRGE
ncbi:flagellar basal body rod protein FlgB [Marinimicrobium sp. ABcell2]|uniref:flagellar basal body rod protein FlgB n=1 Tax=Marinimicrobium sp. ABcell2 TaxID=3069751 RepID=UPI0027B1B90C|nr:flagellar basal body rod protein FlgB [Marinimicrobium sp. ABcell2]MDQ2077334.1 flagellar basal body rod protein FlgB [Marinimicrobium sp. ABcell2]